jgi:Fe-S cluster assembly protein SufD
VEQRMMNVMETEDIYRAAFREREGRLERQEPAWLAETRQQAMEAFDNLGFPQPHDEDWRFTNVAPITSVPFQTARRDSIHCAEELLQTVFLPESLAARLVFINGHFTPQFSKLSELPAGVRVGSLSAALAQPDGWLRPYLARSADYRRHAFTALNTALWEDGAYLHLAKGTRLTHPIHLVFVCAAKAEPLVCYPRTLVIAEEETEATLVESYVGLDGGVCFSNAVTEVIAGENAVLDHYRLQRENPRSFHVGTLQVYQSRSAQFSSCSVSLGGALVRNEVNAVLDAPGAGCTLNGLFVGLGHEHVDNHTSIDHAKPHCSSRQLYNGILGDECAAVFHGGILVRPDAQKTDAIQRNRNLLLSPDAAIDTKPQLEIFANDVRCTHGATVGQMDSEALFYLCSRGIGREQARGMLIYAFAAEILERIRPDGVRTWVTEALRRRLTDARA